jgi:hypothetical protein
MAVMGTREVVSRVLLMSFRLEWVKFHLIRRAKFKKDILECARLLWLLWLL